MIKGRRAFFLSFLFCHFIYSKKYILPCSINFQKCSEFNNSRFLHMHNNCWILTMNILSNYIFDAYMLFEWMKMCIHWGTKYIRFLFFKKIQWFLRIYKKIYLMCPLLEFSVTYLGRYKRWFFFNLFSEALLILLLWKKKNQNNHIVTKTKTHKPTEGNYTTRTEIGLSPLRIQLNPLVTTRAMA